MAGNSKGASMSGAIRKMCMADGGKITGPGTGTSDSVPIDASAGEFIMPADSTRKIGVAVLTAMRDATHKPAKGMGAHKHGAIRKMADGGLVTDDERQKLIDQIPRDTVAPVAPEPAAPPTAAAQMTSLPDGESRAPEAAAPALAISPSPSTTASSTPPISAMSTSDPAQQASRVMASLPTEAARQDQPIPGPVASLVPAAQRALTEGVTPSTAGAGRGAYPSAELLSSVQAPAAGPISALAGGATRLSAPSEDPQLGATAKPMVSNPVTAGGPEPAASAVGGPIALGARRNISVGAPGASVPAQAAAPYSGGEISKRVTNVGTGFWSGNKDGTRSWVDAPELMKGLATQGDAYRKTAAGAGVWNAAMGRMEAGAGQAPGVIPEQQSGAAPALGAGRTTRWGDPATGARPIAELGARAYPTRATDDGMAVPPGHPDAARGQGGTDAMSRVLQMAGTPGTPYFTERVARLSDAMAKTGELAIKGRTLDQNAPLVAAQTAHYLAQATGSQKLDPIALARLDLDQRRAAREETTATLDQASKKRLADLQELVVNGTPEQRQQASQALAAFHGKEVGGAGGKPMPASAAKGLLENQTNLRRAQNAAALLNGGTVNGVAGDKNATGFKGMVPNTLLNRVDPAGVDTRATIADLGSLVVHDRSGAAVTAAEFPRLAPFIPSATDDPATARKKLNQFINNYQAIIDDQTAFYSESGYKVPAGVLRQGGADKNPAAAASAPAPVQPAAAPPPAMRPAPHPEVQPHLEQLRLRARTDPAVAQKLKQMGY